MEFKNKEEFICRMDSFITGLILIQHRHYYWFESRHGLLKAQQHDVIGNHVVINCEYPKVAFGYWAESELPQHIRDECNNHFNEQFNRNNPDVEIKGFDMN